MLFYYLHNGYTILTSTHLFSIITVVTYIWNWLFGVVDVFCVSWECLQSFILVKIWVFGQKRWPKCTYLEVNFFVLMVILDLDREYFHSLLMVFSTWLLLRAVLVDMIGELHHLDFIVSSVFSI